MMPEQEHHLFKNNPADYDKEDFFIHCCEMYSMRDVLTKVAICIRQGDFECKYKGERDKKSGYYKCEFYKE